MKKKEKNSPCLLEIRISSPRIVYINEAIIRSKRHIN
jgi:hypothetical protein